MKNLDINPAIKEINEFISQHNWMDFEVKSYDGFKLVIAGSTDLMYYHLLEISFEDVFWFSGFVNGWKTDTTKEVLKLANEHNLKLEIEEGYQLFEFETEDYKNNVFVAARIINFSTEIKKLYKE